jgi:selenocysteine lyase/cysteine desulfurase
MEAVAVKSIGWLSFRDPFVFVREKELAPHYYNSEEEIDRIVAVLPD